MTCEQLTDRILSSTANIDSQAFRTGRLNNSDWNDFAQATSLLYNAPIYMDDSSGISVPEIKAKISHDQSGSQEGKNRACYHRLPAADAECQAHREPRAGDQ